MVRPKSYDINGYSLEEIRNRNETRVTQMLREEIPNLENFCGCRLCVEDAYAAALNQMPAHYVQAGAIVLKKSPEDDNLRQIVKDAIVRVAKFPKHPSEPVPLPTSSNF